MEERNKTGSVVEGKWKDELAGDAKEVDYISRKSADLVRVSSWTQFTYCKHK